MRLVCYQSHWIVFVVRFLLMVFMFVVVFVQHRTRFVNSLCFSASYSTSLNTIFQRQNRRRCNSVDRLSSSPPHPTFPHYPSLTFPVSRFQSRLHYDSSWSEPPPPPPSSSTTTTTTSPSQSFNNEMIDNYNGNNIIEEESSIEPQHEQRRFHNHNHQQQPVVDINRLLDGLNPSQVEAVTQPIDSITRVIAGPGSGKTRVLTCRIAYLLLQQQQRGAGSRVLAVTFTRKAAGEMQQRIEQLLSSLEEDDTPATAALTRVTLGTFHSICAKILRYNGELLSTLPSVIQDSTSSESSLSSSSSDTATMSQVNNLDGNFAILDQSDQLRILKECLDEQEIDLKKIGMKPLNILNSIGTLKERRHQGLASPDSSSSSSSKPTKLSKSERYAQQVYAVYRQKLLSQNALDFDDLIFLTRELLMEHSDIRERLHKRWQHVLVDEFQDTSKTQLELIQLLTTQSLLVVGDMDQSIYSWRGAHIGSLSDLVDEFPSIHTVYLKENYRSTSNIVKAAEKVISGSSGGGGATASNNEDKSLDEVASQSNDDIRRAMKPKRGAGPSPRVVACADERGEAMFVVETILEMIQNNEISSVQDSSSSSSSAASPSSVAIIYRTNAQSRHLEEACVKKNLPYVIRGGAGGFYKRAEIKDCLCFLRWIYNGSDQSSMIRAIKTPSKGIGDKALEQFFDYCLAIDNHYAEHHPTIPKRPTYLDVLISLGSQEEDNTDDDNDGTTATTPFVRLVEDVPIASDYIPKRAMNNFVPFANKMRRIRSKAYEVAVDALLFHVIEELDLIDHFDTISKSKSEFEDRRSNVQELRQAAKRYTKYGSALRVPPRRDDGNNNYYSNGSSSPNLEDNEEEESGLGNFLDDVALVSDISDSTTDGDSSSQEDGAAGSGSRLVVNLMTIHASKGMEFDAVFVIGNEEGTLPLNQAIVEGEGSIQLEEERRLCYVAMTRAKTRLVLTWRKEVSNFASWSDDGPKSTKRERSRFLNALVSSSKSKANKGKEVTPSSSSKNDKTNHYRSVGQRRQSSTTTRTAPRKHSPRTINDIGRQPKSSYLTRERARSVSTKEDVASAAFKTPSRKSDSPSFTNNVSYGSIIKNSNSRQTSQAHGRNGNPKVEAAKPRSRTARSTSAIPATNSNNKPKVGQMDSTLFYPIGSKVVHRSYGKGVVLEPPEVQQQTESSTTSAYSSNNNNDSSSSEEWMVRIQFETTGKTMDFPVSTRDVTPDHLA